MDREKLMELLGSEEMVDRMIEIFESDMPNYLSDLTSQVSNNDWAGAAITAHTIKSQVAYLGLGNAEYLAREIEEKAENEEDLDNLESLADDLSSELSQYL